MGWAAVLAERQAAAELAEVRMPGVGAAMRVPLHMREVFLDESCSPGH
jgi:hypothetical protein